MQVPKGRDQLKDGKDHGAAADHSQYPVGVQLSGEGQSHTDPGGHRTADQLVAERRELVTVLGEHDDFRDATDQQADKTQESVPA